MDSNTYIKSEPLEDNAMDNSDMQREKSKGPKTQIKKCAHCGVTRTPQWREGPVGPKTLCNACGVKYSREKNQKKLPAKKPPAKKRHNCSDMLAMDALPGIGGDTTATKCLSTAKPTKGPIDRLFESGMIPAPPPPAPPPCSSLLSMPQAASYPPASQDTFNPLWELASHISRTRSATPPDDQPLESPFHNPVGQTAVVLGGGLGGGGSGGSGHHEHKECDNGTQITDDDYNGANTLLFLASSGGQDSPPPPPPPPPVVAHPQPKHSLGLRRSARTKQNNHNNQNHNNQMCRKGSTSPSHNADGSGGGADRGSGSSSQSPVAQLTAPMMVSWGGLGGMDGWMQVLQQIAGMSGGLDDVDFSAISHERRQDLVQAHQTVNMLRFEVEGAEAAAGSIKKIYDHACDVASEARKRLSDAADNLGNLLERTKRRRL